MMHGTAPGPPVALSIEGVSYSYGPRQALADVTFVVVDLALSTVLLRLFGEPVRGAARHLIEVDALTLPVAWCGALVALLLGDVGWWAGNRLWCRPSSRNDEGGTVISNRLTRPTDPKGQQRDVQPAQRRITTVPDYR